MINRITKTSLVFIMIFLSGCIFKARNEENSDAILAKFFPAPPKNCSFVFTSRPQFILRKDKNKIILALDTFKATENYTFVSDHKMPRSVIYDKSTILDSKETLSWDFHIIPHLGISHNLYLQFLSSIDSLNKAYFAKDTLINNSLIVEVSIIEKASLINQYHFFIKKKMDAYFNLIDNIIERSKNEKE